MALQATRTDERRANVWAWALAPGLSQSFLTCRLDTAMSRLCTDVLVVQTLQSDVDA